MSKLVEDMMDTSKWRRCSRINKNYIVSIPGVERIYVNSLDTTTTSTNKKYPVLVKDTDDIYWTISTGKLKREFCLLSGSPITDSVIATLYNGRSLKVRPKYVRMWVYHADIETYKYDCPYGINKTGKTLGSGDYIICYGKKEPSMSTMRIVRDVVFKRQYKIEEG